MIDAKPGSGAPTAVSLLLWSGLALTIAVAGAAGIMSLARRPSVPAPGAAALTGESPSGGAVSGVSGSSQPLPTRVVGGATAGNGDRADGQGNGESATGKGNGESATGPGKGDSAGGSGNGSTAIVQVNPNSAADEQAPDFSLTDRSGKKVGLADLRGKVWIANFIFTRCGTVCPTLTKEMSRIREELAKRGAPGIVSVSFTVDPAYDTPAVLKEYADGFRADPSSWFFLTGEPSEVLHVVKDGFHLMMSDPGEGAPMHSNRFIIVDAEGRLRSSHLGTEEGVVDAIVKDVLALQSARPDRTSFLGRVRGDDPHGARPGLACNRACVQLTGGDLVHDRLTGVSAGPVTGPA